MRAYRKISDLPLRRRVKALLGKGTKTILPRLASQVHQEPFHPRWGLAGRLIRNAHLADAVDGRDHETLQRFFMHYWSSETSSEFYDSFAYRFEELFLRYHAGIVDRIAAAITGWESGSARLVEAGSGDGRLLQYLTQKLTAVGEFHGIDLNAVQIARCREIFRDNGRLFFHEGNLLNWLGQNPAPNTIFVTNGGVLEYLLRHQLLELFRHLREKCSPCVVAVTETMAVDHDLEREVESLPYGHEFAFSHHYPAFVREAGFEIHAQSDRLTQPGEENHPARWFQLVASA